MNDPKHIAIIGGGIGGYPAAITAARMGARVTLIERGELGGTCLNRGCIPTKSLLQSGAVVETLKNSAVFGIPCQGYEIDFPGVMNRKNQVVQRLRKGVETLLAAKKIRVVAGTADVQDPSMVRIRETGEQIGCDRLILATGSEPVRLDIPGMEDPAVWDSARFLDMEALPQSAAIVGGGVIGVEYAQILNRLGAQATIVELTDTLVPGLDAEIAAALRARLEAAGIRVFTGAGVEGIEKDGDRRKVRFTSAKGPDSMAVEAVVLCVGRRPCLEGIAADRLGIAVERGAISVNDRMQTSIPSVYAAGDVTGGAMLAHAALAESVCAAVSAMGGEDDMKHRPIPSCIYTDPEVAAVGRTEEEAGEDYEIRVARLPFSACGKALLMNASEGMVKIVSEKTYGEILGVHIIGPHATDLIGEAVLGMGMEMTAEELARAVHPHPTLSEAVMESAMGLCRGSIHLP